MTRILLSLILLCALWPSAKAGGTEPATPDEATRTGVVRQMLSQSRLLEDANFTIPLDYWKEFLRAQAEAHGLTQPPPVPMIAEAGTYHLSAPAGQPPVLHAAVRLHVFRPAACANTPVLWAKAPGGWDAVAVNGRPATLPESDGWLRFSPTASGDYVVTATSSLKDIRAVNLAIPQSVRTELEFQSPSAMEVAVAGDSRLIRSTPGAATRGSLALSPRDRLEFSVNPRGPETEHAPTFEIRGDVAWNFDPAGQTVTAALDLAIVGGKTETIDLALPPGATRVTVTGPDVREARPDQGDTGAVRVFLRGPVAERTRLELSFQLPAAGSAVQTVGNLAVRRGHWVGGAVVCTSTGGGSEAVQDSAAGLTEIALADIPASAAARLAGPAALAWLITGRDWFAGVELLNLGEFALRESIADAAHYELLLRDDGSMMCRTRYDIRNRNKQFLRVELPAGAAAVLARVNEQSRPLAPIAGERDAYLLPLVRSKASLKGLVSFPVEIVAFYRVRPLATAGDTALPLPRIDLPIAYAKCEAWLPAEMSPSKWSGVLQQVARYADESGGETFGYGHAEAAEKPVHENGKVPVLGNIPVLGRMFGETPPPGYYNDINFISAARKKSGAGSGKEPPQSGKDFNLGVPLVQSTGGGVVQMNGGPIVMSQALASNYYRAGNEAYEKGDYANAAQSLQNVVKLAPGSVEAANAERLLSNSSVFTTDEPTFDLSARMARDAIDQPARTSPVGATPEMPRQYGAFPQKKMKEPAEPDSALHRQLANFAQKPMSKSEKVAAQEVKGELGLANRKMLDEQRQFLERGQDLARQGKRSEARDQLDAANALGQELSARGADVLEQQRRLREATNAIEQSEKTITQSEAKSKENATHEIVFQSHNGFYTESETNSRSAHHAVTPTGGLEAAKPLGESVDGGHRYTYGAVMPQTGTGRGGVAAGPVPPAATAVFSGGEVGGSAANGSILMGATRVPPQASPAPAAPPQSQVQLGTNLALQRATKGDQLDVKDNFTLSANFSAPVEPASHFTDDMSNFRQSGEQPARPVALSATPSSGYAFSNWTINDGAATNAWGNTNQPAQGLPENGRINPSRDARTYTMTSASGNQLLPGDWTEVPPEAYGDKKLASQDEDFRKFVYSNYKWAIPPQDKTPLNLSGGFNMDTIQSSQAPALGDLAQKLSQNLGQKVPVASLNLNVDPSSAAALGITFQAGLNGVNYALIDEAQFRTLAQLAPADDGRRSQETIVGTDALLSNGWRGNVEYAADRYNTLGVNGNTLQLPHEKYLLFNNGDNLTAVRTGAMQFWKDQAAPLQFAAAPQEIIVPRVGQLVKFEKTLVKPTDDLGLLTHYQWKGAAQ